MVTPLPAASAGSRGHSQGAPVEKGSKGQQRHGNATDRRRPATEPDQTVEEKIQQLRELFADAPEVGKRALENVLGELTSQASEPPPPPVESAGRVGIRLGKVSELTIIVPFAPGGAQRLRAFLQLLGGNLAGADKVGTVHDMRFVFLDNDTRMLFATAYDGDWDAYIDDFATKIPDYLDIMDSRLGRLAGDSQPGGEGLPRQAPDHGRRLVRRQSGSDGGGDAAAEARRPGGGRVPGQDRRLAQPPGQSGGPRPPDCPGEPVSRAAREESAMHTHRSRRRRLPRGPVTVELDDIQATVLRYRPEPYYGTHVMLHVEDAQAGREFLRRLAPHVDSAADWWQAGEAWIAVAISYAGLVALGVPEDSLQSFPEAFRVGMAARADSSGTTGPNDPAELGPAVRRAGRSTSGSASSATPRRRGAAPWRRRGSNTRGSPASPC